MLREGGGPRGEGGGEEVGARSCHGCRVQVGEPISGVAEARLDGHQHLPVPLSRRRQQPRNHHHLVVMEGGSHCAGLYRQGKSRDVVLCGVVPREIERGGRDVVLGR
jgi:hypothetical protein